MVGSVYLVMIPRSTSFIIEIYLFSSTNYPYIWIYIFKFRLFAHESRLLLLSNYLDALLIGLNQLSTIRCLQSSSLQSRWNIAHHWNLGLELNARKNELLRVLFHHGLEVRNPFAWINCRFSIYIRHENKVNSLLVDRFAGDVVCSVENRLKIIAFSSIFICNISNIDILWFLSLINCTVVVLEADDWNSVAGGCSWESDIIKSSFESLH